MDRPFCWFRSIVGPSHEIEKHPWQKIFDAKLDSTNQMDQPNEPNVPNYTTKTNHCRRGTCAAGPWQHIEGPSRRDLGTVEWLVPAGISNGTQP